MDELRLIIDEAFAAFHGGDLDNYMTFVSDDLEMWPPFGMPVIGKPACEQVIKAMMASKHSKNASLNDVRTVPMGDQWAQVAVMGANDKGEKFKNLTIWRNEDGKWQVVKDIWSSADPIK